MCSLSTNAQGGVFFDLDGTLIDTAPDFYTVVNELLRDEGLTQVSYEAVRGQVSNGARALVKLGFGLEPGDANFDQKLNLLLDRYLDHLAVDTHLFHGMNESLDWLDSKGIPWGVVTNKPERFTLPVIAGLGLETRIGPIICPDHVAQRKPDPEGLLMACNQSNTVPAQSIYVGDHVRDIEAGKRANMKTVTALFGYIDSDEDPLQWQADHDIEDGHQLLPILEKHFN